MARGLYISATLGKRRLEKRLLPVKKSKKTENNIHNCFLFSRLNLLFQDKLRQLPYIQQTRNIWANSTAQLQRPISWFCIRLICNDVFLIHSEKKPAWKLVKVVSFAFFVLFLESCQLRQLQNVSKVTNRIRHLCNLNDTW